MSHTLIRSRILREHPLSGTSKVGLEGDKDERRNYGLVAVSTTFNVLIMDHVRNWLWWRFSGAEESVLSFEIHKTKASRTSSSFLSCECLESRSWAQRRSKKKSSDAITVKIKSKGFPCREPFGWAFRLAAAVDGGKSWDICWCLTSIPSTRRPVIQFPFMQPIKPQTKI